MKHIPLGKFGVAHFAVLSLVAMRMESLLMALMLLWIGILVADVVQMDFEIKYGIRKYRF